MSRLSHLIGSLVLIGLAGVGLRSTSVEALEGEEPFTVYLVPNTHGTVGGWLVDFDTERSHVVNNYLSHMDRVASDPNYAVAISEVPNLMALMQFAPERFERLKKQAKEGRLELVNGFFLEPTVNLSGGEALVQMGVLGLRWYDEVVGRRPRFSWMIDVCGVHRQLPQIVSGLGLDALVFGRNNPATKSAFWWRSPDGSRALTLCIGQGYSATSQVFKTADPLTHAQMAGMRQFFEEARSVSPSPGSIMVLVGGGDYSLAPKRTSYPSELLQAWQRKYPQVRLLFAPPGQYLDTLKKEISDDQAKLPEYAGDTVYSYNAFWMNIPEIKLRFRRAEHLLGASEMLATAASLKAHALYPSEPFYNSWILMLMNMDRNTLWGAGAGDPFYSPSHWNSQDRFHYVEQHSGEATASALRALTEEGRGIALFNPLNWERKDPIQIVVPAHTRLTGVVCQPSGDGLLCAPRQPSAGISSFKLESGEVPGLAAAAFQETVETPLYILKLSRETGAITSLRDKASGREYLGGPANVILAESVTGVENDPANWMPPRPKRKIVDSSSRHSSEWQVWRGPVATILVARSGFVGTSSLERRITLYNDFPRIDFDTMIDLRAPDLVVTADFPLAGPVVERSRGIPYGFSSGDPGQVNRPLDYFLMGDHKLYGFSDALAPAVRWSDYGFAGTGGGLALLDRGLPCHELNGDTVTLALLNAQSTYRKLANTILAGQGRSNFSYAIWPHAGIWQRVGIAQRAWEYNSRIIAQTGRVAAREQSFLKTSPNTIVEAMRRIGKDIEIRLVECLGVAGEAEISLNLPHQDARITNLMGEEERSLSGKGATYRFPVRPQQIVTLRFRAASVVATAPAIRTWDHLVPPEKRAALHQHLDLQGYPGGEPN